jgi:hypothetical protein
VRRGGDKGILEFVQFADELENMLLHIFRLEAKALPKRPAKKGSGRQEPRKLSGVEDIIGKGSAVVERQPVMPQTVLLRPELSPAPGK